MPHIVVFVVSLIMVACSQPDESSYVSADSTKHPELKKEVFGEKAQLTKLNYSMMLATPKNCSGVKALTVAAAYSKGLPSFKLETKCDYDISYAIGTKGPDRAKPDSKVAPASKEVKDYNAVQIKELAKQMQPIYVNFAIATLKKADLEKAAKANQKLAIQMNLKLTAYGKGLSFNEKLNSSQTGGTGSGTQTRSFVPAEFTQVKVRSFGTNQETSLAEVFKGARYAKVIFFGPRCGPCLQEAPQIAADIQRNQAKYKKNGCRIAMMVRSDQGAERNWASQVRSDAAKISYLYTGGNASASGNGYWGNNLLSIRRINNEMYGQRRMFDLTKKQNSVRAYIHTATNRQMVDDAFKQACLKP